MPNDNKNNNSFLLGLNITLGTVVIGLISFILYTTQVAKEMPRCEYNGWAYAHGESFEA